MVYRDVHHLGPSTRLTVTRDEIVQVAAVGVTASEVNAKVDTLTADFTAFRVEARVQWAAMTPVLEAYKAIAQWARFAKWGTGCGAAVITIVAGLRALAIL